MRLLNTRKYDNNILKIILKTPVLMFKDSYIIYTKAHTYDDKALVSEGRINTNLFNILSLEDYMGDLEPDEISVDLTVRGLNLGIVVCGAKFDEGDRNTYRFMAPVIYKCKTKVFECLKPYEDSLVKLSKVVDFVVKVNRAKRGATNE